MIIFYCHVQLLNPLKLILQWNRFDYNDEGTNHTVFTILICLSHFYFQGTHSYLATHWSLLKSPSLIQHLMARHLPQGIQTHPASSSTNLYRNLNCDTKEWLQQTDSCFTFRGWLPIICVKQRFVDNTNYLSTVLLPFVKCTVLCNRIIAFWKMLYDLTFVCFIQLCILAIWCNFFENMNVITADRVSLWLLSRSAKLCYFNVW